jgi:nickel/cobalt transporter (NicO) family protein
MPSPSAADSVGWVLVLGLGLGLRHASDADHVASVSTLLRGEPGTWRAARLAALWGIGHSVSFGAVGLLLVVTGIRMPQALEQLAELLAAVMLVGFGAMSLLNHGSHEGTAISAAARRLRPALIGFVHGLAGSGAIALLVGTTVRSAKLACLYLVVFGLGTTLGMVLLTTLLSWFIRWSGWRASFGRFVELGAGWLSIGLGIAILASTAL